jgi:hypothetical protein
MEKESILLSGISFEETMCEITLLNYKLEYSLTLKKMEKNLLRVKIPTLRIF